MHSRRSHWYQRIAHSQHRPDKGPRWAASLLAWARQAECTAAVPHHRSYAPENLKVALRLRPAYGPLGGDHVNAVAAVLDCAATDVERTWCSANLTGEP
jgi:hypothetical protein